MFFRDKLNRIFFLLNIIFHFCSNHKKTGCVWIYYSPVLNLRNMLYSCCLFYCYTECPRIIDMWQIQDVSPQKVARFSYISLPSCKYCNVMIFFFFIKTLQIAQRFVNSDFEMPGKVGLAILHAWLFFSAIFIMCIANIVESQTGQKSTGRFTISYRILKLYFSLCSGDVVTRFLGRCAVALDCATWHAWLPLIYLFFVTAIFE